MKNILITEEQWLAMERRSMLHNKKLTEEDTPDAQQAAQAIIDRNPHLQGERFFQEDLTTMLEKYPNFANVDQVPNVEILPYVDSRPPSWCQSNKCESNAFEVVKRWPNGYVLVAGYLVEKGHLVEHFWVYDPDRNKHIDVTPLKIYPDFYIGIKLPQLTDDIVAANEWWKVNDMKGGAVFQKYFKPHLK